MKKSTKRITVEGIVSASGWDDNYNIVRVSIITDDDDKYLVSDDARGERMKHLIFKRVRVKGTVMGEGAGGRIIHVDSFKVIGSRLREDREERDAEKKKNSAEPRTRNIEEVYP